jgi:hypothetical protein
MLNETTIEHRVATLEQEVANLKQQNTENSSSGNWLNKLIGSISDESALLEALDYGRSYRQSDKPVDDNDNPA